MVYKSKREIVAAFRGCGLRHTPQRYVVIEYLMRHPVQATADDIDRAVNRSDRRTSRATVYNSLHALADSGLVRGSTPGREIRSVRR